MRLKAEPTAQQNELLLRAMSAISWMAKTTLSSRAPSASTQKLQRRLFQDPHNGEDAASFPQRTISWLATLHPPLSAEQLEEVSKVAVESKLELDGIYGMRAQTFRRLQEGDGSWMATMDGQCGAVTALGDRGPGAGRSVKHAADICFVQSHLGVITAAMAAECEVHFMFHGRLFATIMRPLQTVQLLLQAWPAVPNGWAVAVACMEGRARGSLPVAGARKSA